MVLKYFYLHVKNLDDGRNGSMLKKLFWMHGNFVKINIFNTTSEYCQKMAA